MQRAPSRYPSIAIVLDTGLQPGGWNAAFDQAWLAAHAQGERPDLLRFHRSRPTASIGRHQAIDRELRLDYCRQRGIETVRRASGGGALYLDENQLGLSLIIRRPAGWAGLELSKILARFSTALADGLSRLGVYTRFKAPNDLEIDGRKLASTFIAMAGESLLLHATLLCDADIKTMLEALRAPTEKLTVIGLESARQRLATVREALGHIPPDDALKSTLTKSLSEMARLDFGAGDGGHVPLDYPARLQPDDIDWSGPDGAALESLHKTPGGVLRLRLWPDGPERCIDRIEFAGDLFLNPADLLERLQHKLAGLPLGRAEALTRHFFSTIDCEQIGFTVEDVCHVLRLALDKLRHRRAMGLSVAQANALMVLGSSTQSDAAGILARASVMLLPYCAKPAWCKWRHRDDCTECGKCEVGDAYRLARERNMQVTTITHYEHLTATLEDMKSKGVAAYVGACCSQFFVKRHHAFKDAGMPAVLMDIGGANCYELKQEEAAYAGQFQAEARLDADMLRRVMKFVPVAL